MADAQISQSGPLFPKTSPLAAKCFDLARRADFDDEAVVLNSAQDAGVLDRRAVPVHGFSAPKLNCHLPKLGRMCCNEQLHSRENLQKECIDSASDIMFSCYDIIAGPYFGTTSIEGYVYGDHGDVPILLG